MRNRSVLSVDSFACTTELRYWTRPIAARIEISEMTISSSTSVKPPSRLRRFGGQARALPVLVLGAIECLPVLFRVDVEHVAAAPGGGVGTVGIRAQPPLGAPGHRIDRNATQEL